jgi:hypothetical protein
MNADNPQQQRTLGLSLGWNKVENNIIRQNNEVISQNNKNMKSNSFREITKKVIIIIIILIIFSSYMLL